MVDMTMADSGTAVTGKSGKADAGNLSTTPCLSPAQIAAVLTFLDQPPSGDEVSLCLEALWLVYSWLCSPVATGLDYPPFALSPRESASLARRALQGTDALAHRLGDRGTLSKKTVLQLRSAIGQALNELTAEDNTPIDTRRPAQLSGS